MNQGIILRTLSEAQFIVNNNATVRATAKAFGVSKSTVHKDCSIRLAVIDKVLYEKVKLILDENLAQRHIRGGNATKNKYLNRKINRT
ncbi:MAG: sporulation transcriptional regulator SpoIIID [Clostridia bacterium]|nr:sporulation transcriptional regulator SpoIIID [Clostridia bacterium]